MKAAIMQEITAAEITMLSLGAWSEYNAATMDDMYIDHNASSDVTTNHEQQHIVCPVAKGP
jgi:hypothetical protein